MLTLLPILRQNLLVEEVEAVHGYFRCLYHFNFSLPMSRLLVVLGLRPILCILASCIFSLGFDILNSVRCSITDDNNHRKRYSHVIFYLFVSKLESYFNSFISLATLNLELIIKETSEAVRI